MMVIADAGPIITFARSGYEYLLRQVFSQITIPEAVYAEVVVKGTGRPGASLVQESTWIRQASVRDPSKVDLLPALLGLGEREAIILAEECNAFLLTDDRTARREAKKRGIECLGSLRVLKEAKNAGLIDAVTPVAAALRQAGLHLRDALYQGFLREMEE